MPVAALYDIHGNLPALRAVLAEAAREGVDSVVVGGDVATGPLPRQTLDQLMALRDKAQFVRGNAEREIVDAYDAGMTASDEHQGVLERQLAFAASQLTQLQRDFLASFPPTVTLDIEGLGPTLFCHGSPRSDTESITTVTSEQRLREIVSSTRAATIVCGHTHRQFDRRVDQWRVINAGSVGTPYEGRAGAYWALLGPDVELRRTEYDLDRAVAEMEAGGFPDLGELVDESLIDPVDADEVSEFFERQAISGS